MEYFTVVSTRCLAEHLNDSQWVVVDCRFSLADTAAGARAYAEGHIPGAHYAHLDRHLSSPITATSGRHPLPDAVELAGIVRAWGVGDVSQVVVYDDMGGAMAARLWWLLRWLGHARVAVLDGGITQLVREGRALSQTMPDARAGDLTPRVQGVAWLSSEAVARKLAEHSIVLIDARGAARFRGEEEPIDPVAGHVPGAINRPLQNNLDASGLFLEPETLRGQYQALMAGRDAREVVHMCGSGITACHNLLAMEHAGLTGSRLYVGSWSEWVRDPARPVARGAA